MSGFAAAPGFDVDAAVFAATFEPLDFPGVPSDDAVAAAAAAASARVDLLRAARALPAAVWAPLALSALEAAIRALAAFCAAALPTVLATCGAPAAAPVRRR